MAQDTHSLTMDEKISFIWTKAYADAVGAGEANPDAYARTKVNEFRKLAHRVQWGK